MKTTIQKDYFRHTGKWVKYPIIKTIFNTDFRFVYLFRKIQNNNTFPWMKFLYRTHFHFLSKRINYNINLKAKIDDGFYVIHGYYLNVYTDIIAGKNFNISHGVTIGKPYSDEKNKDTIVIGDDVWIGVFSVLEGNIRIGNNILIAPNSYINFDIPDNSIVIGSPARIITREDATLCYVNNKI